MDDDRVGGAVVEFLEALLGPLVPIKDHVWLGRPIARLQHHCFGWLKIDAVEHGFYPCNHYLALVLLGLHMRPDRTPGTTPARYVGILQHNGGMINMSLTLRP